jgi:hypothetical protein
MNEREREIEIFLNSGFIFIHNRTSIHRRGESQQRALHMRDIYGEIVMPQRGQELEFIEEEGGGDRLDGGASATAASPTPFGHRP